MSFPQFAFNNVRRNSRAYMAFFLSSAFMVMIFFSYSVFVYHPGVRSVEMGENSAAGMKIASYIVYIFAFFFVLYSISAFLKRRNHEFGILTILGARPGQINRLIFLENMIIGLLSIATGIAGGMLLSRLFLLLSTRMIGIDNLPFYWPVKAMLITAAAFISLFLVISVFTLLFIRRNQVLELLTGTVKPKTPPKVSWLLALFGIALLTAGAVIIRMPVSPLTLLAAAVTGIAGTYFFYSQLTVLAMRVLKFSRRRLWQGTNLLWISEMGYKLKDNARMLFMVTVVTSLACMASGFLLSLTEANKTNYTQSPFAFSLTLYSGAEGDKELAMIRSTLGDAGVEYRENRVETLTTSIAETKDGSYTDLLMLPLSTYNELAPQMNRSVISGLGEQQAVLINNGDKHLNGYSEGRDLVVIGVPGRELTLQSVDKVKVSPLGLYSRSLLVVDDRVYAEETAHASASALKIMYLYKIPAWDKGLPVSGEPETELSMQLAKWSSDHNREISNWDASLIARADQFMATRQSWMMLSFIGVFIALIFSLSSASFLYFRLHSELNTDMRMYHALSKIGLSIKEMSASATRQMALLFYIPILIAAIQTLVVIRPILHQIGIMSVTVPVLVTSCAFLAIQSVYFLAVRSRYIHSLRKIMV
ncbi:FtsX-like permease family protein [Paenibacillus sp. NFR01]|uniref:FtsX-like permease family protein n=1 Tax=Paenibacillus sp. NFR01 TaxID=1566279 RepID=UPI0008B10A17|nr:FtsX-like permease family protein [Paenibacillus sp. NFR01]SET97517.1 putative ABC transport system permease protein [Paenibacillus sp. NFR01]